jgi:hypothetical protein
MKAAHVRAPLEFAGDERWELINRILESKHFAGSARLRDFLVHVTSCALRQIPEEATEQQVGIRVFQRQPGFNTSDDSIVRSQARLLRMKLAAYFNDQGASEEIRVEIPKGGYLPQFSKRAANYFRPLIIERESGPTVEQARSEDPMRGLQLLNCQQRWSGSAQSISIAANPSFRETQMDEPGPLDVFWGSIFNGPRPMVIYSNEPFVRSSDRGVHYAKTCGQNGANGPVCDHLTGVGEVQAVFHITRLFERRGAEFVLKRSSLVPWDDAKQTNLVFIGSTAENPALRVLPSPEHFQFTSDTEAITNSTPLSGEPKAFRRSEHPITRDYAMLSLGKGFTPSRQALVFAGLTTLGTQAAVEYACNPETVCDLLRKVARNGSIRPFEAILEVSITGGVPLQAQLVAVRVR